MCVFRMCAISLASGRRKVKIIGEGGGGGGKGRYINIVNEIHGY